MKGMRQTGVKILVLVIVVGSLSSGALSRTAVHRFRRAKTTAVRKNIHIPKDYTLKRGKALSLRSTSLTIRLFARNFAGGELVYLEIVTGSNNAKVTSCRVGKRKTALSRKSWGYRGFFPLHPELKPGNRYVTVKGKDAGVPFTVKGVFYAKRGVFPFNRRPLDLGKYSDIDYQQKPENLAFIKICAKKKRAAFRITSESRLGHRVSHPRDMHFITSPYWAKRVYMRYKFRKGRKIRLRNRVKVHRGLDLRGEKGTPVFSLARGRVVLAEKLFYEGNMVIIDHGNRLFSYFMHLDSLDVLPGDMVGGGDIIGKVGSSGVSTAAHLHVSLMMRGIQVDPLSILYLPIRD